MLRSAADNYGDSRVPVYNLSRFGGLGNDISLFHSIRELIITDLHVQTAVLAELLSCNVFRQSLHLRHGRLLLTQSCLLLCRLHSGLCLLGGSGTEQPSQSGNQENKDDDDKNCHHDAGGRQKLFDTRIDLFIRLLPLRSAGRAAARGIPAAPVLRLTFPHRFTAIAAVPARLRFRLISASGTGPDLFQLRCSDDHRLRGIHRRRRCLNKVLIRSHEGPPQIGNNLLHAPIPVFRLLLRANNIFKTDRNLLIEITGRCDRVF